MKKIQNKWYVTIWNEGRYIDFWFFNHFFFGFLLAGFLLMLETPHWLNFLLLIILMILWEWYEYYHKVREALSNRLVDLLVGTVGFLLMYLLHITGIFDYSVIFIGTFILFFILEVWGYWAYKIKKKK